MCSIHNKLTVPRRALPLTIQYGISIFLHKAGSQTTNSIGSTSWAITTSWALFCKENIAYLVIHQYHKINKQIRRKNQQSFVTWQMTTCSMRYVTWLRPYFTLIGFLVSTVLPSASAWALFKSLSFFSALSSGLYFRSILNKLVAAEVQQSKIIKKMIQSKATKMSTVSACCISGNQLISTPSRHNYNQNQQID